MPPTDDDIRAVIGRLLQTREASATLCPSEAARALAPEDWRMLMPRVRDVAIEMARAGELDIRQRGRSLPAGTPVRGPIRLGRPRRVGDV